MLFNTTLRFFTNILPSVPPILVNGKHTTTNSRKKFPKQHTHIKPTISSLHLPYTTCVTRPNVTRPTLFSSNLLENISLQLPHVPACMLNNLPPKSIFYVAATMSRNISDINLWLSVTYHDNQTNLTHTDTLADSPITLI